MNNTEGFKPKIGKNVIENLTEGMYDDSRFVYREYVQNAADQIDIALKQELLKTPQEAYIYIQIDKEGKCIVIEDNATGIEAEKVLPLLGNIAQSNKNRYTDKGFRGIGRLGGLGYCDKLTFETSFKEEATKCTMVWDAKRLKEIIKDDNIQIDAAELISVITSYSFVDERKDTHYFRVTMEGVNNDALLDVERVREYLSMVAPLPFASHFTHRNKIYEEAARNDVVFDEYNLLLNQEQLFKGYKSSIFNGSNVEGGSKIIDVAFFKEYLEDTLLYWGWYGISPDMHQIPDENKERGIRLRKSNIQIGLDTRLDVYHKEKLGNRYFIGEVHAINKELTPNARRDFFIENEQCVQLTKRLQDLFHKRLYTLYYDFSKKNAAFKDIKNLELLCERIEDKSLNQEELKRISEDITKAGKKVVSAKRVLSKLESKYSGQVLGGIIKDADFEYADQEQLVGESIKNNITQIPAISSTTLSPQEEAILRKVYKVIRQTLIKQTAEEVILKIDGEVRG